jgi:predicted transcriptional regulator
MASRREALPASPHEGSSSSGIKCYDCRKPMAQLQTKQAVRQLLDELPEGCTVEDVQYELYFLDLVQRGLAEADAGKTFVHEQVMAELRRKWSRSSEP